MSNPYLSHLLERLHADLELLAREKLLDGADVRFMRSKLDSIPLERGVGALQIGPSPGPSTGFGSSSGQAAAAGAPRVGSAKGQCKAVWNYTKSQPDDLGFQQGDVIDIIEEVNHDWWKGQLNGQTGLFPSNHVERIENSSNRAPPPPPPAPTHSHNSLPYNAMYSQPSQSSFSSTPSMDPYVAGPPPQSQQGQFAYQTPQNYSQYSEKQAYQSPPPPPAQHFTPPPPPPQHYAQPSSQTPNVIVSQEEDKQKKKFPGGKFGKQVGTAFAGGMGFGAGSAITSNAINAIF